MRVDIWDNNGNWVDFIITDTAPMVDDYMEVGGDWYKVWRRFISNDGRLHIQLSIRLSMSSLQMPSFKEEP